MIAELFTTIAPYTPLVIFTASFFDVFCLTGLFLYGGAMLGSVAMLHATGMISTGDIIIAATLGTLLGSTINFYIGYYGAKLPFIQKLLQKPVALKIQNFTTKRHLFFTMLLGRYITLARPLYSLVLGALQTKPHKFFMYEIPIVLSWVLIWLFVLLQGEKLFFHFFGT